MSRLEKRLEQQMQAVENILAYGCEVTVEALKQDCDPFTRFIAHISLSASAKAVLEGVMAQPTKLFSTKSPRLDKRRVRRYNRLHKIMLAKPNRQTGAAALIDAINSEIAL